VTVINEDIGEPAAAELRLEQLRQPGGLGEVGMRAVTGTDADLSQ